VSGLTSELRWQDPIVLRRRMCGHLVTLRGARTQREVAEALDWSPSKMLRIENGSIGISTTDLRALLAYYEVTSTALIGMLERWAKDSRHPVSSPYTDVLEPEMAKYLRFEASAVAIRQYNPYVVPGLLQTGEYARALITALTEPGTPTATIDRQVDARLSRQAVIRDRGRATGHFIVDEAALRRPVGDHHLMHRQLAHLEDLAGRSNVTVQLLPLNTGIHRGSQSPFVLLDFDGEDPETLLYLEGRETRLFRDDPVEVAWHESVFRDLAAAAISADRLIPLIESSASAA